MKKQPKKKAGKKSAKTSKKREGRESFEARLRNSLQLVDAADALTSPLARSIDDLMRVACEAVNASEASVIVRDGNKGALKFMSAIGQVADKLLKVKIPAGKGVAGFVYSSGQPMAVTNAAEEESFYAEVDRATGYTTQTLLATPLRLRGEVIGVLELINRPGPPPYEPFTPGEMDLAAHFADAVATLVDAYENAHLIENIFDRSMKTGEKGEFAGSDELRRWAKNVRSAPEHRDMLLIAIALTEIADAGEAERELCRKIVEALGKWTKKKTASPFENFRY